MNPPEDRTPQYIVDHETQRRESVATHRLLEIGPISERLLTPLGLSRFCWAILELRLEKVISGIAGEIDILAGPLTWTDPAAFERELAIESRNRPDAHPTVPEFLAAKTLADDRGIAWPPRMDYLVGVEVKCAYEESGLRSTKASPQKIADIRKQIMRDLNLGLDRVAFVDIIAHHPSTGNGSDAWLTAGADAQSSLAAMSPTLAARLPDDSAAGQFAWSIGTVAGGDETMRGAGAPILLRPPQPNPWRTTDRSAFEGGIAEILRALPHPTSWPVILRDCRPCNAIHAADAPCRS